MLSAARCARRAITWDEFLARGEGFSGRHQVMEANETAYILATSGTTAKPKLAVHTHGGYQVHIASMGRWCFGLKPSDMWWTTSDIGWVVGHSYMVYAPLLAGCTTIAFEGALDHPTPDAHWRAAVEELGATGIFTSPTAVRLLRRYGEHSRRYRPPPARARCLRRRECNPLAWDWLQNTALKGACRSSITCGRPKPAARCSAIRRRHRVAADQAGSRRLHCRASMPRSSTSTAPCPPNEKGIMVLKRRVSRHDTAFVGRDGAMQDRLRRDHVYYSGDSATWTRTATIGSRDAPTR